MRTAASDSAWPVPVRRALSSTTTSSIQARRPVGMGNMTSVSVPTTSPSSRATSSVIASCRTIAASVSRSGGGALRDSCGTRRANAATSSPFTSVMTSTSTWALTRGRLPEPLAQADHGGGGRGGHDHEQERQPRQQRRYCDGHADQPGPVGLPRLAAGLPLYRDQSAELRHPDQPTAPRGILA